MTAVGLRKTHPAIDVSGHFAGFPLLGHLVVLRRAATHDGGVTSTQQCPQGRAASRRARLAAMSNLPVTDLERFWPSRRGHAFDEFCR
jgi:hypothetical protein